ncbi:hypothetical protein P692DRAFT_20850351 [Suillus brevipes Sb2]|nr:hypothetical protein P692DRAFT_20850351 [Suillus brevipes Sb2]
MPYRQISRNLKLAAVNLFKQNLLTIRQIVDCLWRETGDVVRHNTGLPGQPQSLNFKDVSYLLRLINHFHFTTIYRELTHAGMSLKKLKKISKERNESQCADFI